MYVWFANIFYRYKNTNIPWHQFHRWYKHLCLIDHHFLEIVDSQLESAKHTVITIYAFCHLVIFNCDLNPVITTCKYTLYDSYEYYKYDESRLLNEWIKERYILVSLIDLLSKELFLLHISILLYYLDKFGIK